jgi:hypothetical protein
MMHMIKKGQVKLKNLSAPNNAQLINQLFGLWCKVLTHDNMIEMKSWEWGIYIGNGIKFV